MKSSLSVSFGYTAICAALGSLTALISGILVFTGFRDALQDFAEPNLIAKLVVPMLLGGIVCGIAGFVFLRTSRGPVGTLEAGELQLTIMKGAAFGESSIPMLLVDRTHVIRDVNQSFLDLLTLYLPMFRQFWPNISPETIVGQTIDQFHRNPGHHHKLLADLSKMPFRTDITVGDFNFALNVSAAKDAEGRHVGSVLEWVDVTEARVNSGIIDAIKSNQGVIELSTGGEILFINKILEKILGYSAADLKGKPISFLNPAQKERSGLATSKMWEELRSGEGVCDKFLVVAKNGNRFWFNSMFGPVCDQSGKPYKIVALMTDVTALEDMTFGQTAVSEFTPKGHILRANKPFLDMMGYSEAELAGKHHSLFLPPEHSAHPDYQRMWLELADGKMQQGTFRRLRKDGRVMYITGTYSPIRNRSGHVVRVAELSNDVTQAETERLEGIANRERAETQQAQMVSQLTGSLAELARGNLTTRLSEEFAPEYEVLRNDFNSAVEELETVLAKAFDTSDAIRDKSGQMTQAADELAHRTETQASALEQAAASLEELTASVRTAAENAEKANTDVETTRESAEESGRIVREAVDAMGEIEKSSEHISRIISVIEDIAFQTNLLALNAGVEAARAGEAGRGFAVVASEVRALAQRSSDAAKEISSLISTSSQQVGRGVDLVRKSGQSLDTIVSSVAGVTSLVEEIAHSAREQSAGLSEINTAVTQLDQVTQQNAAMVEESTAASRAVRDDVEAFEEIVKQFDVKARPAPAASKIRSAAPQRHHAPRPAAISASWPSPYGAAGSPNTALAIQPDDTHDEWTDF